MSGTLQPTVSVGVQRNIGRAIDGAAQWFKYTVDNGMDAEDFVLYMKQHGKLIPCIGHRIKSVCNPDLRVDDLKRYARAYFSVTSLLDFALEEDRSIHQLQHPQRILRAGALHRHHWAHPG
jgi:citrate synthase